MAVYVNDILEVFLAVTIWLLFILFVTMETILPFLLIILLYTEFNLLYGCIYVQLDSWIIMVKNSLDS